MTEMEKTNRKVEKAAVSVQDYCRTRRNEGECSMNCVFLRSMTLADMSRKYYCTFSTKPEDWDI